MEITPTVSLPAVQANTLAQLLNKLQEQNIPEADRSFSQTRATTSEKPERLDSFETLKGYLNRIKTAYQDSISDIDLADPAVEAAATKIQSAFKGYKTRKNIGNNSQ